MASSPLPKLLSSEAEKEMIEDLGGGSAAILLFSFIVPVCAALVLKGVLSKLWAMMNTFQLINELSILPIQIPSNVSNVQKESIALINFNPVPKDVVYGIFFDDQEEFPSSEEINY